MNIKKLQKEWDEFGRINPLWAIITYPDKLGKKWQIDEFFKTGDDEIATIMKQVSDLRLNIRGNKALDFGCGVGRLTQALSLYFEEVVGVDIAPSMIELAKKYNRYGDKCKYYLNEVDNLDLFADASFDFIYTNITLQHIEPRYSKTYIKSFLRILAPGGLLIFQLPSERKKTIKGIIISIIPHVLLNMYRKNKFGLVMEMHVIKKQDVVKFLEENGAKILDIRQDQSAGKNWVSFQYYVTKD